MEGLVSFSCRRFTRSDRRLVEGEDKSSSSILGRRVVWEGHGFQPSRWRFKQRVANPVYNARLILF
jgi:hypothetical protein